MKKTSFVCQQCGASYAKWMGQCANCQTWNSLIEQMQEETSKKSIVEKGKLSGKKLPFIKLGSVIHNNEKIRLKTGLTDLDMVLGGGILLGSVSLLAGQPGIGKSTLLMQVCAEVAKQQTVLYVSGEESAGQVK